VALPIISAVLRLPLLVTLALLVTGTVLLMFSPHLAAKHVRDPKKAWLQLMATFARLQSAYAALEQSPADAAARRKFAGLAAECLSLLNSRPDSDWGADSDYAAMIRKQIAHMSAPIQDKVDGPSAAPSPETERLEDLRKRGLISESEFQALSGKLKVLAADKARGLVETISELQLQYRQGGLTEENLRAALRSLLGGLDHGDSAAAPKPAKRAQPGQGAAGG
jgi:hypothetical protein